jgi:hypothetical protein
MKWPCHMSQMCEVSKWNYQLDHEIKLLGDSNFRRGVVIWGNPSHSNHSWKDNHFPVLNYITFDLFKMTKSKITITELTTRSSRGNKMTKMGLKVSQFFYISDFSKNEKMNWPRHMCSVVHDHSRAHTLDDLFILLIIKVPNFSFTFLYILHFCSEMSIKMLVKMKAFHQLFITSVQRLLWHVSIMSTPRLLAVFGIFHFYQPAAEVFRSFQYFQWHTQRAATALRRRALAAHPA